MSEQPHSSRIYIGAYTNQSPTAEGIFVCSFDADTGHLEIVRTVTGVINPSYLTLSADRKFLYAVNELEAYAGQPGGAVSAFSVDPQTGGLTYLNTQPTHGGAPCYVSLDKTERWTLVANYSGGNVTVLPVLPGGELGAPALVQHYGQSVHPQQSTPHAHCVVPDPDNQFFLVADLGLDKILIYRLEAGTLTPNTIPDVTSKPGAGPRHLVFHPNGRYVYVSNELDSSVSAYEYDGVRGALSEIDTLSTLPADYSGGNSCADIQAAPSGQFVYVSNRGHNSIAVFAIEAETGRLSIVDYAPTGGQTPRNFAIHPSGKWVLAANQNSDEVRIFSVDAQSGRLTPTDERVSISKPVCIKCV